MVLKRRGELAQAEEQMREAERLLPRAGFVQVALGNLQYLQDRLPEAEGTYRHAADLLPSSAAVQLNLSKLYTLRLQLEPSKAALTRGLKLDPHMIYTASEFHGQGFTEFVTDESVPWKVLAAALAPRAEHVQRVAEGLWGAPLRGVPLRYLPYVVVGLLSLFWGHVLLRGWGSPVRRCHQCRTAFCAQCQPNLREREHCRACLALFRQREAVAAFVKLRHIREGEEWLRKEHLRAAALGTVVPGGSDIYRGHMIRGLLVCLPAAWLTVWGLGLDLLTPSFRFSLPIPEPLGWTATLLLLALVYGVSIHRAWSGPTALAR